MFSGFHYIARGLTLMFKPKLRRFVLIPLLINIGLFALAFYGVSHFIEGWIAQKIGSKADWWHFAQFLYDYIVPVIMWLLYISLSLVIYYTFILLANIVAAPFNGFLAHATEEYLKQTPISGSTLPLGQEIYLSITSEIGKTLRFILYCLPLLLVLFIPLINVFFPLVWLLFTAYGLALQYVDYPMGNHALFYKQQRQILQNHRASRLGFGLMSNFLMLIPVLNFFAMPACVIGATIWWVEEIEPKLAINNPRTQ